jgi:hypothetical protein
MTLLYKNYAIKPLHGCRRIINSPYPSDAERAMPSSPSLSAFWIWRRQDSYTPYHQVILARKTFRLAQPAPGSLKIAVDGAYRLYVNGEWVADGPARSWPEHFQYDEIDVTPYLAAGRNELVVIARHWQVGDFHNRPQQAGLLFQLDLEVGLRPARTRRRIISDSTWETAWLRAWAAGTPKVSIQMEPQELYDARLEDGLEFTPAVELYPAAGGPWSDLHRRDVALLTRRPVFFRRFLGANLVRRLTDLNFCLPAVRLAHPGAVEANHFASANAGMATLLELAAPAEIQLALEGMAAAIDGVISPDGRYALAAGRHLLAAFAWPLFGHCKERSLRIIDPPNGLRLLNPADPAADNPWVCLVLPAYDVLEDDMDWFWFSGPQNRRDAAAAGYQAAIDKLLRATATGWDSLARQGEGEQLTLLSLPAEEMFVTDTHWQFTQREVIGSAAGLVERPGALMHDHAELTTVHPSAEGDVELAYDLGEETVGYFDFDLLAPAGVQVDLYAVEYIRPRSPLIFRGDGVIQHTDDNHNGLRYITRPGLNRFTSLKRRAGRYLFITLRGAAAPLQFRLARVIESTYPVESGAFFECSDARLGRIWEISAHTLKMCMEDTFTDCPLYEQTGWVGDARNEALFALDTFGAADIVLRGLRLAAQSLERYSLVGGQVPSSWDMLLPAWSFLWGIGVWDYYFFTGDRSALEELWPAVVRNLEGAEGLLDNRGLFSGKFWNMFDWTPVDDHHPTVLHNSLLLVGAVEAAIKSAGALGVGDAPRASWLAGLRARLVEAVNRTWDAQKQAYPDSLHEDGLPSGSTSMHTSFLALLYGAAPAGRTAALLRNALTPPAGMVRIGSPFAMLYLYEALAGAGQFSEILASIYENYLPMLAAGATTVWEVFPTSGDHPGGFPTRSHCQAWSSAPLRFLPQIVLGIRQAEAGGAAFTISPWLGDLEWGRGAICTGRGLLEVSWRKEKGRLLVSVKAPAGVELRFEPNESMEGLEVSFE